VQSHAGRMRDCLATPRALGALFRPIPRTEEDGIEHYVAVYQAIGSRSRPSDDEDIRELARTSVARGDDSRSLPRQMAAILASGSRHRALRHLQTPTLILHGTEDPLVRPAAARAMARWMPQARLAWIEGMGHGLPRWAWPEIVAAVSAHVREQETASGRRRAS
jgi:pimeloyl-ACP methyl ester carboxylesterase